MIKLSFEKVNKLILCIFIPLIMLFSCKKPVQFKDEKWADGSIKQLVEIKENKTYDKTKLISSYYIIKLFREGETDSLKYYSIKEYYDNGQLSKITNFDNGKINGKVEGWYENGQKALEENYINGKLNGKYTSWFPNGELLEEFEYKMDTIK